MPETNEALVFSRLAKRVRELGLSSFEDYIELIDCEADSAERTIMIEALTTNTTRFFREDYHFDIFVDIILPELKILAENGERVRLWSAGCSSGEEAYTLASVVLRHFPAVLTYDFKILATDIDRSVLSVAEAGQYRMDRVENCSPEFSRILFEKSDVKSNTVSIRSEIRDLVSFRYLNFVEPWPVRGPFDVIFCRNVLIYMKEETQARIWLALASVLRKGGLLFIGHSERLGVGFQGELEMIGKTAFRRI